MSITNYRPEASVLRRIWSHASFGLKQEITNRNAPRNFVEKSGDAILWVVESIPRSVKAVVKSFQDPRVVTVALTVFALFAASIVFYPSTTVLATKSCFTFTVKVLKAIPLWAVRFSAYIATCATIIGGGLRAGGRFNNAELMKQFYQLPGYAHNPSRLYAFEIAEKRKTLDLAVKA